MMRLKVENILLLLLVVFLLLAAQITLGSQILKNVTFAKERAVLIFDRSAERAYSYGDRHFSSLIPEAYNIEDAEYFYTIAYTRNSELPYLNHQLARIDFLHGNFTRALTRINKEFDVNPEPSPSSYYIRALIEGFMGLYASSAKDYETYLETDPTNWAAVNDYAWVLLKADKPEKAALAVTEGLRSHPFNPWLLNSGAIALHEMGKNEEALDLAREAARIVMDLTEEEWLIAYPGNDPKIAREGILALQESVRSNLETILVAIRSANE